MLLSIRVTLTILFSAFVLWAQTTDDTVANPDLPSVAENGEPSGTEHQPAFTWIRF
jgi:hypothetical protein